MSPDAAGGLDVAVVVDVAGRGCRDRSMYTAAAAAAAAAARSCGLTVVKFNRTVRSFIARVIRRPASRRFLT